MEVNKDEALRSLSIAQKHYNASNYPSARKFCLKSIALYETPEAAKLLARINEMAASAPTSESAQSATNTTTEEHPSAAGIKHRNTKPQANGSGTAGGMGGEKRDYTPEQAKVVQRVRSCRVTEYYEILEVKKDCEDNEIKKAYRKVCVTRVYVRSLNSCIFQLALALHPDKNGAPGADEAFKRTRVKPV